MEHRTQMIPYFIQRPIRRHIYKPYVRYIKRQRIKKEFGVQKMKYACEIEFWKNRFEDEGGQFKNGHYEELMLGVAGEDNQDFLRGKIVADFGCGPRGSLQWADQARLRIGIDVLADEYARFGTRQHDMCYVTSTENWIPLPTDYVDVLFTTNAVDHVDNLETLCEELRRILAPGGTFIGAFNLGEPRSRTEPQTLDEQRVEKTLLKYMDIESYRLAPKGPNEDPYKYVKEGNVDPGNARDDGIEILWVRATLRRGK